MGEIRGTIDDAINRLVTFCTKYPYIWRAKSDFVYHQTELEQAIPDEEERRKVVKDIEQAEKDLEYIKRRIKLGKIPEEQIQALNDAGVFGGKDEVDELAEQYDKALRAKNPKPTEQYIKQNICGFKSALRVKLAQFGGLEKYRQAFIDALVTGDEKQLINVLTYYTINMIDISQDDFIAKFGFTMLLQNIEIIDISIYHSLITDSQFIIDNSLKHACEEFKESERNQKIMEMIYGLDNNEPQSPDSIAEENGISRTRVKQIKENILIKIRREGLKRDIEASMLEGEAREAFIRKLFEHRDIFRFSSSEGLTEEVKAELRRIYEEGTRDAKEDVILREQAVKDIQAGNVTSYVFDDDTDLSYLNILPIETLIRMNRKHILTVGDFLQRSTQEIKRLFRKDKNIIQLRELLEKVSFKTDSESVGLTDNAFDVLNFPGDIDKVLAKHIQPTVEREGIPFSVADFIMMPDDEISEISAGPRKIEQIKAIRNKLRGYFRDIDVEKIEEGSHEKLVQIALMRQQTIAEQEQKINEMTARQSRGYNLKEDLWDDEKE